jgi:NAD(P)H-binding
MWSSILFRGIKKPSIFVTVILTYCWIYRHDIRYPSRIGATLALSTEITKVAVIGTTGRLGREAIKQLSQQGIATRCLVRNLPPTPEATSTKTTPNNKRDELLSYLRHLPGVELISGDINDRQSLVRLVEGTTACLALHGPTMPKPFLKALIPLWFPETDPQHPKQINYVGIQKLLSVMTESSTCKHLVRITGKGETPWSIFSILINALGGIAKGWNYEGEQLIRSQQSVKYTIIRPGIMKESIAEDQHAPSSSVVLGLRDNGNDMKVSVVSYEQIANLTIQVLSRMNCHRTTLTAMNVNTTTTTEYQSIDEVQQDTREFPESLIEEHKKAARVGGLAILCFGFVTLNAAIAILLKIIGFIVGKLK